MFKMQYVRSNVQGSLCKMECVRCNVKMGLLVRSAGQTCWTGQLDRPAGHSSWTDQLDRPARRTSWQTSWTDQFFLFEALASSHIWKLTFQFVHCRSFRVRQRPCFVVVVVLLCCCVIVVILCYCCCAVVLLCYHCCAVVLLLFMLMLNLYISYQICRIFGTSEFLQMI